MSATPTDTEHEGPGIDLQSRLAERRPAAREGLTRLVETGIGPFDRPIPLGARRPGCANPA